MEAAVCVRNACKSYGSKKILKSLSMEVEKGTIYGLLGASGCGKTTLLTCIVGVKKLESGDIWVLGEQPGTKYSSIPGNKVGYMPQEIALVGEFTVKDAIYYFGRIMNVSEKLIAQRFGELKQLLDLPPEERLIKNCSGGQQRRVSFAAAMIHMPELLILDEPTAGIDPLLRERIWNYLQELTIKKQTTVIITTHYIDETRQANKIGLMRDGILLSEESPSRLLNIYNTDTLEEVFLILSKRQEEGKLNNFQSHEQQQQQQIIQNSNSNISTVSSNMGHGSTDVLTKQYKLSMNITKSIINKRRLRALMNKNWKQFYRNLSSVAFLILFPIFEILAFLLAVGSDVKNINLAIVNNEYCSSNIKLNETVHLIDDHECQFSNLSCRFLDFLNHPMIHKVPYDDLEDAFDDIRHGKVVGAVHISNNFSESLKQRLEKGRSIEPEILDSSEIKVWFDLSNRQIGETIKYKLLGLYEIFQKAILKDCKYDEKITNPITFQTFYGKLDDTFTIFMTSGMVLTIMFFMGTVMTSQIIINDRLEGVWDRSAIAGVTSLEITITHFALQASIILVNTLEVFFFTFVIFDIRIVGNVWVLLLIAFLQGITGMTYGFWVSIISYNHSMANIIATGSFYPMILICGLVWPLEGMPVILQWISKCLPFTIPIISFRNVMQRGWSLKHLEVLNGICIELVWIISISVLSIFLIQSKR